MVRKLAEDQETRLDAWLALTGRIATTDAPVRLPVLSGSMAPAIPAGAVLTISQGTANDLQAGDVAVFLADDRLVAHRVLLVLRCGAWRLVLEKGDANSRADWRRGDQVRGKVTGCRLPDGSSQGDPAAPALASEGLRQVLRNLLRGGGVGRT